MRAAKSKALATWLALLGGCLGLHRFYLHGAHDVWAWLHLPFTALGGYGVLRMLALGQDDRLAWVLVPLLGLALSASMLAAIVHGLTSDEKWDDRFNAGVRNTHSGWPVVLGVIGALMVGSTVLMATIAFSSQRFFEWQAEAARPLDAQ